MIFDERINFKPFEYPELIGFSDAIQSNYWTVKEFPIKSSVNDFKNFLSPSEQEAVRRTVLALSQIEVTVKSFWGDVYKQVPKPEISIVGSVFSESEVRHAVSYAEVLNGLNLNDDFEKIFEIPAIIDRVKYLNKAMEGAKSRDKKKFTKTLILFSLFVENCALFSQFLISMSFYKYRGKMKGISNVTLATGVEEGLHAKFGMALVKIIRDECPEMFDAEMEADIIKSCHKAFKAEVKILDWVFEEGELDFLPKQVIKEFLKDRFNQSLVGIDYSPQFEVDNEALQELEWFDVKMNSGVHTDFFSSRPTAYTKKTQSFSDDDLF